jgi:hypothetical protein
MLGRAMVPPSPPDLAWLMSEENMEDTQSNISPEEVVRRLRALNSAKQALAEARTHHHEQRYVTCYRWFLVNRIAIHLADDCFVLSESQPHAGYEETPAPLSPPLHHYRGECT